MKSGIRRALWVPVAWLFVAWLSWRRRVFNRRYRSFVAQARHTVDKSLRDNARRLASTPGRATRSILWGAKYPLPFALYVGFACIAFGAVFIPSPWKSMGVIPLPDLPTDYAHPGFFGTAWSVQATLVALVYPIVLTFVAIMLQRRALSKVALRVYMLDSGVLPAGSSSVVLLAVMTLQYQLAFYIPNDFFLAMAACVGAWLLTNIVLTGVFLARTVRYIEDEVGQRAYKNLGVSLVLRDELVKTLSQHLYVNAPDAMGWGSGESAIRERRPQVLLMPMDSGDAQVARVFKRERVLNDVRIGIVEWVAKRWLKRARAAFVPESKMRSAMLQMRVALHGEVLGPVDLCSVVAGPALTSFEASVLSRAFKFGKRPRQFISSTTLEMLEELGIEVQSLTEQRRHAAVVQAFDRMKGFHVALLEACEEGPDEGGELTNAAGIGRAYGWSSRSLNSGWLEAYRPLIQLAVRELENDHGLLEMLTRLPNHVVAQSGLRLPKLIDELFLVVTLIDHHLSVWWQKQAQRAAVPEAPTGLQLPQPWAQDYRDAVIAVVGGVTNFRFPRTDGRQLQADKWKERCSEALTWANHIECSANLLLDAVARGDVEAAIWYEDHFVYWWGSHDFGFEYGNFIDFMPGVSDIRLGIVQQDWLSAEKYFSSVSDEALSPESALHVIWHALRRYWESMRLVACLLLLQQAQAKKFEQLAVQVVSRILGLKMCHAGQSPSGLDLTDPDEVLALYLDSCFADPWVGRRLDEFCEQRFRWKKNAPVISGWGYTGFGEVNDIESRGAALSQILLALKPNSRRGWTDALKRMVQHEDNLNTLETISRVVGQAAVALRGKGFRDFFEVTDLLRAQLEKDPTRPCERRPVFWGLTRVRDAARELRLKGLLALVVSPHEVADLAKRLSVSMVNAKTLQRSRPFCAIETRRDVSGTAYRYPRASFTRENLTEPPRDAVSDSYIDSLAEACIEHTFVQALARLLTDAKVPAIPVADSAQILIDIVAAAAALRTRGLTPLAIVSHGPASNAVRGYNWGRAGLPALPPGITVGYRQQGEFGFADAFVNDVPVITGVTPTEAAYVVPLEWLSRLVLQAASASDVVSATYAVSGPNQVAVDFVWNAAFPTPPTSTDDGK